VKGRVAELGDVILSVLIKVNAPTAVGSSALFGIKSFILQTSSNHKRPKSALLQTLSDSVKESSASTGSHTPTTDLAETKLVGNSVNSNSTKTNLNARPVRLPGSKLQTAKLKQNLKERQMPNDQAEPQPCKAA
jgi:hypothetical protein